MENIELKKQEKEFLTLNRLILSVIFILITVVLVVSSLFVDRQWLELAVILVFLWAIALMILIYQTLAYKYFRYGMNADGLFIYQGVLWRKKIVVPLNRVQHTDVLQGPLERQYDLAQLTVHTAGTRNASIKLPGISHEKAEQLRESLSFAESNDAV